MSARNPRVAINGFGRIGRAVFKIAAKRRGLQVVAINDLVDTRTLAYLLKYDSVYGRFGHDVKVTKDSLVVDGKRIRVIAEREPEKLPWKEMRIDAVVESTGFFTDRAGASRHLQAGAKKVIISAPAKHPDITIAVGINDNLYDRKKHNIISTASCTTNCLAPVAKVLNDRFGIVSGFMTTVHAYTNDQKIIDVPHSKLRRGRAAALNIIPTTSGATTAVTEVIPALKGRMDGLAMRVPVANGSIVDFVAQLSKKASRNDVNAALRHAANTKLRGILQYSEDELVSADVIGNPHSSIVDGLSTQVIGGSGSAGGQNSAGGTGNMVKVLAWYDNEWGYSSRLVDMLKKL